MVYGGYQERRGQRQRALGRLGHGRLPADHRRRRVDARRPTPAAGAGHRRRSDQLDQGLRHRRQPHLLYGGCGRRRGPTSRATTPPRPALPQPDSVAGSRRQRQGRRDRGGRLQGVYDAQSRQHWEPGTSWAPTCPTSPSTTWTTMPRTTFWWWARWAAARGSFNDPLTEIYGTLDLVSVSTNVDHVPGDRQPHDHRCPDGTYAPFQRQQIIDPTTLAGIQITCAGPDGTFYDPVPIPTTPTTWWSRRVT